MANAPDWRVVHYNLDGVKIAEVAPEQLAFGRYLNRPGYINYDIDLQLFAANYSNVGSYRTDFELKRDDLSLLAGLHTAVSADMDELVIHIAGYGWLHYLERRTWPFAMGRDQSNDGKAWWQVDVGDIVTELVSVAGTVGKGVNFVVQPAQLGILTNYRIDPADSETLFDKITTLSQQKPGFDFEATNDKQFIMYIPEKGTHVEDYVLELGTNIKSVHYGDNGPVGNYVLATGAGSSSKVGVGVYDTDSEQLFRRHDQIVDFGDDPNFSNVGRYAHMQLDKSKNPNLDIWVTIYPQQFDAAYEAISVGDYVRIIADMDYVSINDFYRVTGIEGYLNAQGDEQLVFTFNDPSSV